MLQMIQSVQRYSTLLVRRTVSVVSSPSGRPIVTVDKSTKNIQAHQSALLLPKKELNEEQMRFSSFLKTHAMVDVLFTQ